MTHLRCILGTICTAAGLCGCSVGPDYLAPEIVTPASFGGETSRQVVTPGTSETLERVAWWRTLRDPELNLLVQRAIDHNPDIEVALTRVQALRTQETAVVATSLPLFETSAGVAAGTGVDVVKGRTPQALDAGVSTTGYDKVSRIAGFDASWELDIWGKYRRQIEAVQDDAAAARELRSAVLITVIADVARTYVELLGLQHRLDITGRAVKTAEKTAELAQARFSRGLTNELDATVATRELATMRARIPVLTAAIAGAKSRLSLLVGAYSSDLSRDFRAGRELPQPPLKLKPGAPADLLRRRPDIRQSERDLAAATARIGVATANLFPTVTFTAGLGLQGGEVSSSSKTSPITGPIWSAGPGAYWPLLDFGRIDALINIQELAAHEALVTYKKTILRAIEEVTMTIDQYRLQQRRLHELILALDQSHRAVVLARERYERGITDFLNLLDAQRQEFIIDDEAAVARQEMVIQYISLYKALGGGWELYETLPPPKESQFASAATLRRISNNWK
jgi:NodT family efflux transporter outer membrane factor (OMF) lipoprotein